MVVSFLKLPLSAVIIATSLTVSAGLAVGPLIIVGVVTVATWSRSGSRGASGPVVRRRPSTPRLRADDLDDVPRAR